MWADDRTVKYVHSILETNDSTLWIATVGEGIVKIILDTSSYGFKVKSAKRFVLDGGKRASNYFLFLSRKTIRLFGLVTGDMVLIK